MDSVSKGGEVLKMNEPLSSDIGRIQSYSEAVKRVHSDLIAIESGFKLKPQSASSSWVDELFSFANRATISLNELMETHIASLEAEWTELLLALKIDPDVVELNAPHCQFRPRATRLIDTARGILSSFEIERSFSELEEKEKSRRFTSWKEIVVSPEAALVTFEQLFLSSANDKQLLDKTHISDLKAFWWRCHDELDSDIQISDTIEALEDSFL
ncbi:hypothetical protein HK405_005863, partial [Cladochytrium tenue]